MDIGYPMFLYNTTNSFRQSVLHFAIQEIHEDERLFELIPNAHEFINTLDIYNLSPLHYAIQYDRPGLTRWLLRHGANMREKDIYGDDPLQIARKYYSQNPYHNDIVRILCLYEKFQRIKFKVRFIGMLIRAYHRSVHNVWKPFGIGYYIARKDFLITISNEH